MKTFADSNFPGRLIAVEGLDGSGKTASDAEDSGVQVADDDSRITWNSRAQKFVAFRSAWESKHGAAAQKEVAADLAQGSVGPTWTRADPLPFKVLHVASGAPLAGGR